MFQHGPTAAGLLLWPVGGRYRLIAAAAACSGQCTVCTLQARYQTNPGELFTYLFNNKIGSGLAILFHAWASALEQAGDTRKADAVYAQGIESQAQPVD